MKNFLKENWFKINIIVILLIICLATVYYFIFLPQIRIAALKNCLYEVDKNITTYVSTMEADGMNPFTTEAMREYQQERDDCYKQYPQN